VQLLLHLTARTAHYSTRQSSCWPRKLAWMLVDLFFPLSLSSIARCLSPASCSSSLCHCVCLGSALLRRQLSQQAARPLQTRRETPAFLSPYEAGVKQVNSSLSPSFPLPALHCTVEILVTHASSARRAASMRANAVLKPRRTHHCPPCSLPARRLALSAGRLPFPPSPLAPPEFPTVH
jgi:hypothetical protein